MNVHIITSRTITEQWDRIVQIPYMVYLPQRDRVVMLLNCDDPLAGMTLFSDDRGATWSEPRYVHAGPDCGPGEHSSIATGLTDLGNVHLLLHMSDRHWFSRDDGDTWGDPREIPPSRAGKPWHEWDPLLVDRDSNTGAITRIMSFGSDHLDPAGEYFQGYIRFSTDVGRTWHDEICVPNWHRVNEVAFIRAADGRIVAACRTDNPDRFKDEIDHFGGLAVSVSDDDGRTWSDLQELYEHGRHHPAMVLMPDGRIVMSYIIREGYPKDAAGFPQFGIEAVVSDDHGAAWDINGRYVLAKWSGADKGANNWMWAPQGCTAVLLPDDTLLTAYSSGYRIKDANQPLLGPRDVTVIHWRLTDDSTCHDLATEPTEREGVV